VANWAKLRAFMVGEVGSSEQVSRINVPTEAALEQLVTVHGWEAVGLLLKAIHEEKTIVMLVGCGIPFTEAVKVATGGIRSDSRKKV